MSTASWLGAQLLHLHSRIQTAEAAAKWNVSWKKEKGTLQGLTLVTKCFSWILSFPTHWASLVAQTVKNLPVMQKTWVQSLGWEDALEKEMAIHSNILPWRIPMDRGAWRAMRRTWQQLTLSPNSLAENFPITEIHDIQLDFYPKTGSRDYMTSSPNIDHMANSHSGFTVYHELF